jgi:hypothetical protein
MRFKNGRTKIMSSFNKPQHTWNQRFALKHSLFGQAHMPICAVKPRTYMQVRRSPSQMERIAMECD